MKIGQIMGSHTSSAINLLYITEIKNDTCLISIYWGSINNFDKMEPSLNIIESLFELRSDIFCEGED